jgi:hypothetical protein
MQPFRECSLRPLLYAIRRSDLLAQQVLNIILISLVSTFDSLSKTHLLDGRLTLTVLLADRRSTSHQIMPVSPATR